MKFKKMTAITLAAILVAGTLMMPAAAFRAEAAHSLVYADSWVSDIPRVNIQTPQDTTRLYAGMSWKALEENLGVRLIVSRAEVGAVAKSTLNHVAASLGAVEVKTVNMQLEEYVTNGGWTQAIKETPARIRVCIGLPAGSDPAKDYAVISLKEGEYEVLGDLDSTPETITVDTDYFGTYMIISAPAGTFNKYRVVNPKAVDKMDIPHYVKRIPSAIDAESYVAEVPALGIMTDKTTTWAAVGGSNAGLILKAAKPGKQAMAVMENAVKKTNAVRGKVLDDGKLVDEELTYYTMELQSKKSGIITKTDGKLRITMTVPNNVPAYADYAIAVLNKDASVSILKDIDTDAGTITFDTDQFRLVAFLWGEKGAFDGIK